MSLKTRIAASRKGHRVRKMMMTARARAADNDLPSCCEALGRLRVRLLLAEISRSQRADKSETYFRAVQ